jgi:hypothetical protein
MGAARVIAEDAAPHSPADDVVGIVSRPDGYYWESPDGLQQFGPFGNRLEALADRDRFSEESPAEGETVQEAEQEIGIADWIDAETGEPAEGLSRPHIEDC